MVPLFVGDREIVGIYRRNDVSPVIGPVRHDAGYVDGISDIEPGDVGERERMVSRDGYRLSNSFL
jgi:hypothetical protein